MYIYICILYIYMYTIYINNTLPPALAVHEIYRDIFGPPMVQIVRKSMHTSLPSLVAAVQITRK